jgi:hypothetical protein
MEPREAIGIIDESPIYHTRPIGANGHGGSKINPKLEAHQLLLKYNLEREQPQTLTKHYRIENINHR